MLNIFDERKKEPIDYRRSGVITIFVGAGLFLLGYFFLGNILKGVGALVGLIGVGTMISGYLYPNTDEEITELARCAQDIVYFAEKYAVNKFERK